MNEQLPFIFGAKAEGNTFTDRKEEREILRQNFMHGINTIIISPRRIGKTSLVDIVAESAKSENLRIARMDAFACRSERDFQDAFATAVIKATSSKFDEWVTEGRIEEVLSLPERIAEKRGYRIVVCIDEFQQIGEMADSITFQKKLRSIWQHQKYVSYCLYGSKKHMMESIFMNKSNPFYRFGDLIYLKRIKREDWIPFICERFAVTGKSISEEVAGLICDYTECYSSYVQQLAWFVWLKCDNEATMEDLRYSVERLLDSNESLYIQMTESLSEYQMNFLRALTEGVHTGFSRQEILMRYRLGTSANITRLRTTLKEKDLIETTTANHLDICDPVLKLWLRRRVWKIFRK